MKILLAGASGLTGSLVLKQLLHDPRCTQVIALVRSTLALEDPKLIQVETDFDSPLSLQFQVDGCIITLGTTRAKAGSPEAFRKVDLDYVLNVARAAKTAGAHCMSLMSALSADPKSSLLYSRTKGEAEEAIKALGFESTYLLRPSVLAGKRKEPRFGEAIGIFMTRLLSPLLLGEWRKYRAIEARRVAEVLIETVLTAKPGIHVLESYDIQDYGS